MAEEIRKAGSLTFGDKFKIAQWLGCKQEWLHKDQPSYTDVAKLILSELKMTVNPTTLKNICVDTGVIWKQRPNAAAGGLGPVWDSVKTLQDEVIKIMQQQERISAQLAEIRGTILTMCKEANLKTTPAFAARNDASKTSLVNGK